MSLYSNIDGSRYITLLPRILPPRARLLRPRPRLTLRRTSSINRFYSLAGTLTIVVIGVVDLLVY